MIAIFDLDGCLADDRWRRGFMPLTASESWDSYHKLSHQDEPMNVDALSKHLVVDDEIVFITARPEKWREMTERWLLDKVMPLTGRFSYVMLMRPNGDERSSPELKPDLFEEEFLDGWEDVNAAYDDSPTVLVAYRERGVKHVQLLTAPSHRQHRTTPEVLREMAGTFEERNEVYGDNFRRVAPIVSILWPEGVPGEIVTSPHWHLFELIIVKLTRFANSGLQHTDSIHDMAVYAAMIQSYLEEQNE